MTFTTQMNRNGQRGALNERATTTVLVTAVFLSVACAGASRNPVLDKYPPGVAGRTSVFYYDVHGHTFSELRTDMFRLGPKVDGHTFVGETRAPMQWSWRTESAGAGTCAIRQVTVVVNAQITLPRWTPPPDTEPGLVTEWQRFLTALEVHEAGHKDISAKAGREINERLRGLSGPCALIGTRANDIARTIVDRANQQQTAYDATTRHGLTQGTSFGAGRFSGMTLKMSHLVDCGTPPAGRNADSVDVALFVTSRLEASQTAGTTMTNTVQAVARLLITRRGQRCES